MVITKATAKNELARAIQKCLGESTYMDGSENLTTAIDRIARAMEQDGTERIGPSLDSIASAINNLAEAIREAKTP